jgi:hypothetical protein
MSATAPKREYDNESRFVLFKNKPKEGGSDKQPNYRGEFTLNGQLFDLSGWITFPKNGGEGFISGQLRPREDSPAGGFSDGLGEGKSNDGGTDNSGDDDDEPDIPF